MIRKRLPSPLIAPGDRQHGSRTTTDMVARSLGYYPGSSFCTTVPSLEGLFLRLKIDPVLLRDASVVLLAWDMIELRADIADDCSLRGIHPWCISINAFQVNWNQDRGDCSCNDRVRSLGTASDPIAHPAGGWSRLL